MFPRLLWESFIRQKRRKALAGIAILLGTTAVTAMLALATTIGDRIHRELAVYGANIVVTPKAADLEVKVGGVDIKPATGNAYLHEADLEKLKTIFWANNITGVSPELRFTISDAEMPPPPPQESKTAKSVLPPVVHSVSALGLWFNHPFGVASTGANILHPGWRLQGRWPSNKREIVLGAALATKLQARIGNSVLFDYEEDRRKGILADSPSIFVTGIVDTGDATNESMLVTLQFAQDFVNLPGAVSQVEISAKTRPEDAFARLDPDKLTGKQRDLWYCRPYANSIAYQIREAIPGSDAQQVRRVEQTEGTLLSRISGLMWLVSAAALLAAGFAVSAAMATAVMERRGEIGLMRSLGAGRTAIASLFYAESGLLAVAAGALGYVAGSGLAWWLGGRIFPADGPVPVFKLVLLPVIVGMAVLVAILGSTPAIRSGLRAEVSGILRGTD